MKAAAEAFGAKPTLFFHGFAAVIAREFSANTTAVNR
jgi:hypothetical protein